MKKKNKTIYDIKVKDSVIGGGTLSRLQNNLHVSTHTIEILCAYLDCDIKDVMSLEKETQQLTLFDVISVEGKGK
jgi:DNA-binding Xre family transcriptional regulator